MAPSSFDLSAALRPVRRRGEQPSTAKGVLQPRFTQSVGEPGISQLDWRGAVQDPGHETFVRGTISFVGDPNLLPAELQAELASISLIGDPNQAQRFAFSGSQAISERLAAIMFEDPNEFLATLYTTDHPDGAIAGVFMADGSV